MFKLSYLLSTFIENNEFSILLFVLTIYYLEEKRRKLIASASWV